MPNSFIPTRTEARTTTGWRPTAPARMRGWMTFWTTNQPTPMIASAGRRASGLVTAATITGGAQATKGPKNGIAIRMPEAVVVRAAYSSPRTMLQARAMRA